MKILFLVPYPLKEVPSQRFRFEQYFDFLSSQGYFYRIQSFLNAGNWQFFYTPGKKLGMVVALASGFLKRFFILFSISGYDYIFIHREAAPVGPPVIEWIIAKLFRKKIVYDFDDAIWLSDKINESRIEKIIRWRRKVKLICTWSYKVSCGNEYLCRYARQFNSNVILNPTTIDTEAAHNPDLHPEKDEHRCVTIGWTGSHSTLKYLNLILPVIVALERKFPGQLKFLIISNKAPSLPVSALTFLPWKKESEIEDLLQFDIGVMPLPDDPWAKGKCGFKLLQYMALEIPSVASPVGVNTSIVTEGENGLLAETIDDWLSAIEKLIRNKDLREELGRKGRKIVEANYSVSSNTANFLALFV